MLPLAPALEDKKPSVKKEKEIPTLPGVPPRGYIATPGEAYAEEHRKSLIAKAAEIAGGDSKKQNKAATQATSEHVKRDIRLAQAFAFVQNGDLWMSRPAQPSVKSKYASASRLFEEGADIFLAYGRWRAAGEALSKAGEAEKSLNQPIVAASFFVDAGNSFEKVDNQEAVSAFLKAAALYAVLGRFIAAGSMQMKVGEILHQDGALEDAGEAFKTAGDYFVGGDYYPQTLMALRHAGECLCEERNYRRAHELFDRGALFGADDNLTKFIVPQFMLDAGLCLLGELELEECEDYVLECSKVNEEFSVGREKRFLLDTVDVIRAGLMDDFIDHVWNFDHVAGLRPSEIEILEKIYEHIKDDTLRKKKEEETKTKEEEEAERLREEAEIERELENVEDAA
jgi:tetratricopeptide (TPR) repeat protein